MLKSTQRFLEVLRPDIAKSYKDVFQHMAQHMQLGHRDFKNPQMIQETNKPKKPKTEQMFWGLKG